MENSIRKRKRGRVTERLRGRVTERLRGRDWGDGEMGRDTEIGKQSQHSREAKEKEGVREWARQHLNLNNGCPKRVLEV
jgi:hypothetical protein